jgi:metal-responsive CopG/Arc/MetJ family transcriptional regulator
MKTAISIPDPIFKEAEKAARDLHMSRSELYSTALREFLAEKQSTQVTERLNEVYEAESSALDPILTLMQATVLRAEDW